MDTAGISVSLLCAAEDRCHRRDFAGAIELVERLLQLPGSSSNHALYSRYRVAYCVHSVSQEGTLYERLSIPNPLCDQETINRHYRRVLVELDPRWNPSIAAERALKMANSAWKLLSDPARRRAYNREMGLALKVKQHKKRGESLRDENPHKLVKRSSSKF